MDGPPQYLLRSKLCDGDSKCERDVRGGSEPGAVYRPFALRKNGACSRPWDTVHDSNCKRLPIFEELVRLARSPWVKTGDGLSIAQPLPPVKPQSPRQLIYLRVKRRGKQGERRIL